MLRIINKLKNKRGFTLIELIVVLAVLAIILAIAVPRFIGIQKQARIDSDYSTGALIAKAAELYEAREEAEPNNAKELIDKDYISAVQFQSQSGQGPEPFNGHSDGQRRSVLHHPLPQLAVGPAARHPRTDR